MQLSSMRVSEDLLCENTTELSANVWCNCLCSVQKSCARCIQKEHSATLSTRVASISVPNLLKWFCKILFISCTREVSRSAAQKHCTASLLKNILLFFSQLTQQVFLITYRQVCVFWSASSIICWLSQGLEWQALLQIVVASAKNINCTKFNQRSFDFQIGWLVCMVLISEPF